MKKLMHKRSVAILAVAAVTVLSGTGCGRTTNQSAAITGSSLYGGCIPLNQPIPFTATNASVDTYTIQAGLMPQYGGRSIGQVTLGGAVSGGVYQRANADGSTLSMNIQSSYQNQATQLPGSYQNYGYNYGNAMSVQITGVLNLSQKAQSSIQAGAGQVQNYNGYSPYNGGYGQTLPQNQTYASCVSGLAFSLNYAGNSLQGGTVFVYMNNSQYLVQQIAF